MATIIESKFGKRLGSDSAELVYLIRGTASEATALATLKGQAPLIYQGMNRRSAEVDEIEGLPGGGWMGSARYRAGHGQPQQVGDSSFSFNTGGGSSHAQVSLATVGAYGDGATTADNGNLVRATDQGVEGADIIDPVYEWSQSYMFDPNDVDSAFKGALYALTGTVNDAAFKGTAAGETIFKGAAGQQRGTDPWQITFNFSSRPNQANFSVGDITGIAKKGWEFLWVRTKKEKAGSLGLLVQKPAAVYIEKIYEDGDFSALGIGT